MTKRISKTTREQAALICAISASGCNRAVYGSEAAEHIAASQAATDLAIMAMVHVEHHPFGVRDGYRAIGWHRANPAEAESLLRTGWSP